MHRGLDDPIPAAGASGEAPPPALFRAIAAARPDTRPDAGPDAHPITCGVLEGRLAAPTADELRPSDRARRPLLTAEWRNLVMLNYECPPELLAPYVPNGVELDAFAGRTLVSVVGFQFLNTRLFGWRIPFHVNFEEVNLRFYVRRIVRNELRRGVVFIREVVPKRAIAVVARRLYNEPYISLPMSHEIRRHSLPPHGIESVEYAWEIDGLKHRAYAAVAPAEPQPLEPGSQAEFIAEHYWGYTRQRDGGTIEYEVRHPPWRVQPALRAGLSADVRALYGDELGEVLSAEPVSALLAEGSAVEVYGGVRCER